MIEFEAWDGTRKTAEVWSPGPVARSVWALLLDGNPIAINIDTRHEIKPPAPPWEWQARPCTIVGRYNQSHTSSACSCESRVRAVYLRENRFATEPLKPEEFRALTEE